MNFSGGGRGEQGGRGSIPRLPSSNALSGDESPNKPIKPKIRSRSKISPSKSLQKRISQREEGHIGSKIRGDAANSSSSSKEDKNRDHDFLSKPRSRQGVSSPSGLKSFEINARPRAGSLETGPYSTTAPQSSTRRNENTRSFSRRFRARSLDDIDSDDDLGHDTISARTRRTRSEDDAQNAFRLSKNSGMRRPSREDSQERRIPSRRGILSLENAKRREGVVGGSQTGDGNEGIHYHQSEESGRSYMPSSEHSSSGNSVAKILRDYSSGDFSGGSLNVGGDLALATLNMGKERDLPLVDTVPSGLRTPDSRYRRQHVGLPMSLFDPSPTDRSAGNKTPFSSRLMESTSSDSSDQRLVRKEEAEVRFQAHLSACPSVSTRLDDSCVALFDGAPIIPQRTFDREDDLKHERIESCVDDERKAPPSAPLTLITFFSNMDHSEASSISIESAEDDINSVSSFCPSISECISTGMSMADEAPKMPGRGVSQLSMESGSALGAMDDDISLHESRPG